MPRLAVAFEFPTLSGGERSMLAVLSQPPADGWDVVAIAPPAGALADELRRLGIPVVPLDLRAGGSKPPPEWAAELLADAAGASGCDLLHGNSLSMSRVAGRWAALTGRPATGHVRDMMRLSRAAVADVNRLAAVLFVSAATRTYHLRQGVREDTSRVVHNGVDPPPPAGGLPPGLATLQASGGPAVIATVGQICLRKGHDVAADALARLPDVDWRWLVVGERFSRKDESIALDRSLEERLGPLAGRMLRLGYQADVWPILRRADLLLHPARQEPFGRVLLEASSVGTPVVACDVGGTREMLGDDATLVPPDDASALAVAIRRVLASPRPGPLRRFPVAGCVARTWSIWSEIAGTPC